METKKTVEKYTIPTKHFFQAIELMNKQKNIGLIRFAFYRSLVMKSLRNRYSDQWKY